MTVPVAILELIACFTEHRDTYRSPAYKEAQVRIEFLNPVFEALRWDVSNRQGHAKAYKGVISDCVWGGERTRANTTRPIKLRG